MIQKFIQDIELNYQKITEDRNKRKIIKILLILVIAITIVRAVLLSINPIIEEKCKNSCKIYCNKNIK